jgi:hypothetical protein
MIRRLHDPAHTPKLLAFGKRMHAKFQMPFPYSEERCKKLLQASYMSFDKAVWGAFDGNKVCGIMLASIEPFAFMESDYVTDMIFVAEKFGDRLYNAMVQWGKTHGACAVQVGVTSGFEGADKFYAAQGMKRLGGIYFKALDAPRLAAKDIRDGRLANAEHCTQSRIGNIR